MRSLLSALALTVLVFGCQKQNRASLVVEDATPIVGAGRVTAEALGIETLGGVFTEIIQLGTIVPASRSEIFSTAEDGQLQITIFLFRGTNRMAASNHALGRFQIVDIPSGPRGTPEIEVTFSITERQILISARDLKSKAKIEIRRLTSGTR
jgi:molecular chaperone DnaK